MAPKGSTIPVTQVSEMARWMRNMLTYGAKRVHNTSDTCIRDGQIDEEHVAGSMEGFLRGHGGQHQEIARRAANTGEGLHQEVDGRDDGVLPHVVVAPHEGRLIVKGGVEGHGRLHT